MRFVLVDRIVGLDPGCAIEVLKNVSATEDLFDDHFPGVPIFPGAMILEVLEQASHLLIASTVGFAGAGRLTRVSAASFRHLVRPGDQLRARCARRGGDDGRWVVGATATVDGRTVATATLEFAVEDARVAGEAQRRAERVRELKRVLDTDPRELAAASGAAI